MFSSSCISISIQPSKKSIDPYFDIQRVSAICGRILNIVLISASLTLSGCSTLSEITGIFADEDNTEPPSELVPIEEPEVDIQVIWEESSGVGSHGMTLRLTLAFSDEKIIIADQDGLIQARDSQTGELLWEVETDLPISAGPGTSDGQVYVATSDAEVIAFSSDDGESLWTTRVSSEVLSVPRADQGIVVVRAIDGTVSGLDTSTGKQVWSYERTVPALTLRGAGSPVILDDLVIDGFASGKLVALRLKDGKLEWETTAAMPRGRTELERLVDIDADPVIVDDVIYVASFQGGISAVSALTGDILWQREEMSSFSGMSADWRYLYLTDSASDLWELDQRTGAAVWKQTKLHQRKLTAPAVYKDYIVVGDFEGYVHWFSQDDGHQLGRIRIGSDPIETSPIVVDDIIYVYGKTGALAALTTE